MRAVLLLLEVAAALAQPKPKFDVASVKPCDSHEPRTTYAGGASPGRVHFTCNSLVTYVRQAYAFWDSGRRNEFGHTIKIEGGPAWVNTAEFRIDATASGITDPATLSGPMMQSLLEDRFHLKLHRETRQVPVYALIATKGGLKAPRAKLACFVPGSGSPPWKPGEERPPSCDLGKTVKGGLEIHGVTMAQLCLAAWRGAFLDRNIIDRTGIAGRFDFDLRWPDEDSEEMRTSDGRFYRLQGALGRLGLRLADAMGPGEFIVIDHAEQPAGN